VGFNIQYHEPRHGANKYPNIFLSAVCCRLSAVYYLLFIYQNMFLPKGVKKHIRKEKARIRRKYVDKAKQEEEIKKLYKKFLNQYKNGDSN